MGTEERATFGAALQRYRLAAGLSQERLAERAGLSARTLSDLERGVAAHPRLETVRLLATALALPAVERAALLAVARPAAAPPQRRAAAAPLPAPLAPVIGRERELDLLSAMLSGTSASDSEPAPLLLLAGEPGIGKTRLLQAAAQQAITQGWSALSGGCHRHGGQEPYSPLLDALAQHLQALSPEYQQTALVGCAWLVRLLPELAAVLEPLPAGTVPPAQERRLLFAAVGRLLANVAGPAGTLLVLDDLQWTGPDALDLLAALVRVRAPVAPLRVVGAYRDTEVRLDHPFGLLLADLAQAGLARHHPLGPLASSSAAELLAALLGGRAVASADPSTAARVLERAGGTPFYLVSYAQALRAGGAAGKSTDAVPWDVAQGVRQRVALLPEAARQLLGAASIVGRRAPRALLAAAAGQPEEAVLEGLEAACQARLLLEDGEDAYTFAHDVIREVVEADLGAARRAVLHRRVAQDLKESTTTTPAEVLAYHYGRGGVPDKALVYQERAGDEAWAQRGHGAAEHHYRALLERLETLGRSMDALRVREKLGEVLYRAGRSEAALQVLAPAVETFRATGDWESLGRVTVWMGRAHALRGTAQEGVALITPLLGRLDHGGAPPAPLAALYEVLGWILFTAGQYDASLAASERAAALARVGGDDGTRALAEAQRINLLQMLGRLGDALHVGQEALPLTEALGELECQWRVHIDLAYVHVLRGSWETSRGHLDRALAVAEQMGEPGQPAFARALRGWVASLEGDGARARSALETAVALSRHTEPSWYTPYPLIFRARVALIEGAWGEAAAQIQEALAVVERSGDLQAQRFAGGVTAEVDILEGRPEAASACLIPLLDRPGLEECDVTLLLPLLAWAYLEQGEVARAAQTLAQALARAGREEMRLALVDALRVQALVALRQERWDVAARSLAEGVAMAQQMPYPYAEARLLHVEGALQTRTGEPETARERLEGARAIFQRLGAHADVARVEQDLRMLSAAPSPGAAVRAVASARHGAVAPAPPGARRARMQRHAWAVEHLRTRGPLSPRAYAAAMTISVDTALRDLQELVDWGVAQAVGTTRDRRYMLVSKAVEPMIHRSAP